MRFEGPIEDRLAINELCASYGDAVCRHDLKDWRSLWVEDSEWSHPDIGRLEGLDAIAAAVGSAMVHYPQIVFISTPGSICVHGDRATGRDYTSELVTDIERKTYRMTGLYEDAYCKRGGLWYFQARHFHVLNVG
jgi:SnoaL-like domain